VPNTHDEASLLSHAIDKLHGNNLSVERLGELFGGVIQCAAEAIPLQQREEIDTGVDRNRLVEQ